VVERLPGVYKPLVSAEDDEDVAAGVLPEVAGGTDATAVELRRMQAAAAAASNKAPAAAAEERMRATKTREAAVWWTTCPLPMGLKMCTPC